LQRKIAKTIKTPYLGGLRSFNVINVDAAKILVMVSSISVPICNRVHATPANTGKITTFKG